MDQRREKLLDVIKAIENGMTADNSDLELIKEMNELRSDMQDDFFSVVVLGEFKRGKSTFVNALLGEDLLLTDVLPETATIQAIMHSEEKKAQVLFRDKTVQEGPASKDFLMKFSARALDTPSDVKYIKIGHPSVFINEKVVLIDTPGVSDMNEQRVQVTYDFIPKANAVLFVLGADSPMKRSEKEFIEEHLFTQGITKIIFILNKMDLFDDEEEDMDEYLDLVKRRIQSAFEDSDQLPDICLIPVSSYLAVEGIRQNNEEWLKESNILNVKKQLQEILTEGDIEKEKLDRYKSRLTNIIEKWKRQEERELAFYQTDLSALQVQFQSIQNLKEQSADRFGLIHTYVEREKEFIFSLLNKSINKFYDDLVDDVVYEINRYQGAEFKDFIERDIPHLIKKKTEYWMNSHLTGVDRVLTQLEQKLSEALSRYFNKKVFINTVSEEINFKPCLAMTANDISSAGLEAGVITAAGAITLSLMGASVLMPMVSMAVFPMLRQHFLKNSLNKEKEEILPNVRAELRQYVELLHQSIEKNIENRVWDIQTCVQNSYDRCVESYIRKMQNCLENRKEKENRITDQMQKRKQMYDKVVILQNGIANL